jgi:hypothetical protein
MHDMHTRVLKSVGTKILAEQQPPQGVFVCLVINKFSPGGEAGGGGCACGVAASLLCQALPLCSALAILYDKAFKSKLAGNAVYYTNSLKLLVKNILCDKHIQIFPG